MTKQNYYKFGDLNVTQTIIETPQSIYKHLEVDRFNGEYYELLGESDPDYSKAIILMLNQQNGYS